MQQMNYPEGLYNSITGLTNQLVDNNVDYRLSVVSQASGCVAGPTLYIDNTFSSADIQSTFEGMINVQNTYSANSEQNLQTLNMPLRPLSKGNATRASFEKTLSSTSSVSPKKMTKVLCLTLSISMHTITMCMANMILGPCHWQ